MNTRKGLCFGLGIGGGMLSLSENQQRKSKFSLSLPNLHFGYYLSNKFAINLLFPGATYQEDQKTRGFEGVLITGQYWVKNKWWMQSGVGVAFDAPAFWTVENPSKEEFRIGFPALTISTGYVFLESGKLKLDVQFRVFYGTIDIESSRREGFSSMLIFGVNWN